MPDQHVPTAVPLDFYCEHTPSKSRVYALVSPAMGPTTLQALLTCNDRNLAQEAATVLNAAWHGGEGPAVRTEAARILSLLPAAPAASLRNSLEHAFAGHWPDPALPPPSASPASQADAPDTDDDESDPHDIVGAVMTLIQDPNIPGADDLGKRLRPRRLRNLLRLAANPAYRGPAPYGPVDTGRCGLRRRRKSPRPAGHLPIPHCFAEELALHLALSEEAPSILEEKEDIEDELHTSLPAHADDYDWDACMDSLFQDSDITLLFRADMDEIEDPDTGLNRFYGIGDMRPASWFTTFNNVTPRDPEREDRR